ncbi:hypothetical protein AB0O07_31935 [Streptomyces sp. NPDC093085]|uniref:hypothetical protein n=1 Tax=Streptomyces sp. NPDC093085 TaxID=3155068 RepID=UPI00342AEAAA
MTPGTERLLVTSSIATNIAAVATFLASIGNSIPARYLPIAVSVFGLTGLFLLHRFLAPQSIAAAQRVALAAALTLVLVAVYWASNIAWPDTFPLGQPRKAANEPTAHLKVTSPRPNELVGYCVTIRGTGKIPPGYQVWFAHLKTLKNNKADERKLYNLQPASQYDDDTWGLQFSHLGNPKPGQGEIYFLYAYLLPNSAGSLISGLEYGNQYDPFPNKNGVLTGKKIAEIPVERTDDNADCPA